MEQKRGVESIYDDDFSIVEEGDDRITIVTNRRHIKGPLRKLTGRLFVLASDWRVYPKYQPVGEIVGARYTSVQNIELEVQKEITENIYAK